MKTEEIQPEPPEPQKKIGCLSMVGIVLLAGGLFNLPAILKKPQTQSDWMLLNIVLFLLLTGLTFLVLPRLLSRKKEE